jgi:hypothetical protein
MVVAGSVTVGRATGCSPKDCGNRSALERDAEHREPVFRQQHAQIKEIAAAAQ